MHDKAEKAQAELQKALQMTKTAMESRIAEIDEEKASAVNAVKKEMVHASMEAGKQKVWAGCDEKCENQTVKPVILSSSFKT